MSTALPINEVGSAESTIREQYANRLTKGKHVVVLNNFDTPISVTIEFVAVKVFKEGEVATVIDVQRELNLGIDIGQMVYKKPTIAKNTSDETNNLKR